ncbi:MAG: YigZ family protein [Chitinophagaceae bacterium]|nr:YigZ family protein [Chitinophagaceae bacterium]
MSEKQTNNNYYSTIEKSAVAEFKDRGSRFIAFAFPISDVNDFKEKMAAIKKEHPKATHHCFAYRLGLDGMSYRVSDAGEPSATAGRPILGQIDSKQLTNVLIIVVRYFGGTLLGVPGLINAYKSSAAMALQITPSVQKPVLANYRLHFSYMQMNDVMRIIKHFECVMYKQDLQLFCHIEIGVPRIRLQEVLTMLNDIQSLEVEQG